MRWGIGLEGQGKDFEHVPLVLLKFYVLLAICSLL